MINFRKSSSWPLVLFLLAVALFLYGDRSARTQFAQNNYVGPSAGSANAQTITVPNIAAMTDILNQPITFNAGLTNTAGMTLNPSGLGAQSVLRAIPSGLVALGGGEVVAAQRVTVMWDGTQFQLLTNANPALPGTIIDYGGSSCPTGYLTANSQTPSQATYPALFAVLGTIWGSPGGGNFSTPDLRARATYGQDQNQAGFSNRITVAGGNFNGQVVGAAGGTQNWTLDLTQIPSFNPATTITAFTVSGQVNVASLASGSLGVTGTLNIGNFGVKVVTGSTFSAAGGTGPGVGDSNLLMNVTDNRIFNFTSNSTSLSGSALGGGLSHPTLAPGAIVSKCVRA